MLTLTRRIGEKIIIANDIVCTVLDVQENNIRLGFIAPSEVLIHREEIHLPKNKIQDKTQEVHCK